MQVPPKILFVNANNAEVGGADLCLFKMALEMRNLGYSPVVLLGQYTKVRRLYEESGIKLIVKPLLRFRASAPFTTKLRYLFKFPQTVRHILNTIRSERIDLVHSNDFIDGAGNYAAHLAGIPSCQHVRVIGARPKWLIDLLRFLSLSYSDRILCVSDAVKTSMYPNASAKLLTLYDWLDMEAVGQESSYSSLCGELGLAPQTQLVACVGRLDPWKGQRVFIRAAESLANRYPYCHFLLVGGPTANKEDYALELQRMVEISPSSRRFSFLGHRNDVANIMRQIKTMVHSSISPEPFGTVVMEAMHCRALVVAANAGGILEQISDGQTGFLHTPGDYHDLADKIDASLSTPDRDEIIARAYQHVHVKFSKRLRTQELSSVYASLL